MYFIVQYSIYFWESCKELAARSEKCMFFMENVAFVQNWCARGAHWIPKRGRRDFTHMHTRMFTRILVDASVLRWGQIKTQTLSIYNPSPPPPSLYKQYWRYMCYYVLLPQSTVHNVHQHWSLIMLLQPHLYLCTAGFGLAGNIASVIVLRSPKLDMKVSFRWISFWISLFCKDFFNMDLF